MQKQMETDTGEGSLEYQQLDALSGDALSLFRLIAFIAAVYASVAAFALQADAFQDHLVHSNYTMWGGGVLIIAAVVSTWCYSNARRQSVSRILEDNDAFSRTPAEIAWVTTGAAWITFLGTYLLILGLIEAVYGDELPLLAAVSFLLVIFVPFKLIVYLKSR